MKGGITGFDVKLVYHTSWSVVTLVFGGLKIEVKIPALPITSWEVGESLILQGDDRLRKPQMRLIAFNPHDGQAGRTAALACLGGDGGERC